MAVPNIYINLDRDIAALAKLLEQLPAAFPLEERKAILEESAAPMVAAARSFAPKSNKVHYMYATGHKLTNKLRAPKGMGKVSAIFQPGNLSRSIDVLKHGPFKKAVNVYIGPRYPRRFSVNSRIAAAHYAHMVEMGTRHQKAQPYMRPAFDRTKSIVFNLARVKFAKEVDKWVLKNKA